MATAEAKFHLSLTEDLAGAAAAAGKLDAMKIAIQEDIKQLNALKLAMGDMKKGGKAGGEVFDAMKAQAAALQKRIAENQEKFVKLGGSFTPMAKGAEASADSLKMLMESAKGAAGPMGGLFERLQLVKTAIAGGGWASVVIMGAVAVALLTTALIAAVYQMAAFALKSSDAAMKQRAMLEGVAGSAKAADGLSASIQSVASKVPLATAEVQKLASDLYKAGKRGSELETALYEASLEAAGLGKNASPDLIRRRMLNLDVQTMKFREHVATIFAGVKIEKFLTALQQVISAFDSSTASGKALKAIVEVMLNPLFDQASTLGPIVKDMFRGMVVGALLMTVATLKVRNAIRDILPEGTLGDLDGLKIAFYAGVAAAFALAASLAVLTAAGAAIALVLGISGAFILAMFVVPILVAVAALAAFAVGVAVAMAVAVAAILIGLAIVLMPFILLGAAIYLAITQFEAIKATVLDFGASAADAAGSIISGLVNGITSGAGAVVSAMTALAGNAMNAFTSAIGYGSPAKEFIAYGKIGIAGGVEKGVDDGSGAVNAAVSNMVSIPSAEPAASRASGGGNKVVVQLVYQGQDKAEERRTRSLVSQICEAIEDGCKGAGIALELEPA